MEDDVAWLLIYMSTHCKIDTQPTLQMYLLLVKLLNWRSSCSAVAAAVFCTGRSKSELGHNLTCGSAFVLLCFSSRTLSSVWWLFWRGSEFQMRWVSLSCVGLVVWLWSCRAIGYVMFLYLWRCWTRSKILQSHLPMWRRRMWTWTAWSLRTPATAAQTWMMTTASSARRNLNSSEWHTYPWCSWISCWLDYMDCI